MKKSKGHKPSSPSSPNSGKYRKATFKFYEILISTDFITAITGFDPTAHHLYLNGLELLMEDFCKSTRNVDENEISYSALTSEAYSLLCGLMGKLAADNQCADMLSGEPVFEINDATVEGPEPEPEHKHKNLMQALISQLTGSSVPEGASEAYRLLLLRKMTIHVKTDVEKRLIQIVVDHHKYVKPEYINSFHLLMLRSERDRVTVH